LCLHVRTPKDLTTHEGTKKQTKKELGVKNSKSGQNTTKKTWNSNIAGKFNTCHFAHYKEQVIDLLKRDSTSEWGHDKEW
jgi:predicted NAD/FAD-dependent oxidoreductase